MNPAPAIPLHLSSAEHAYLRQHGPVTLCIDPDWEPYESLTVHGEHRGIMADLLQLLAQRAGLTLKLIPTTSWNETLSLAQAGRCDLVSCLNQTPERDQWLLFTEPYFTDANVLITREEHPFVPNLARLPHPRMVLAAGTSIEERLRQDFPNVNILIVKSEAEALRQVSERKADMTLRSLTMAAYVIKQHGYFNLKIAGQIPGYENHFRIGVARSQPELRGLLNRAIATLTTDEIQRIVNGHISIKMQTGLDYRPLMGTILGFSIVLAAGFLWNRQLRHLNTRLAARQEELVRLTAQLEADIAERQRLETLLKQQATTDELTGAHNRRHFLDQAGQELRRASRGQHPLALALIDVDRFKQINDTFGHAVGDAALVYITQLFRQYTRTIDRFARFGGDEFAMLLPETEGNPALQALERIRQTVHQHPVTLAGQTVRLSLSVGVAALRPGESGTLEALLLRADQALYQAKAAGRNQVCLAAPADDPAPSGASLSRG